MQISVADSDPVGPGSVKSDPDPDRILIIGIMWQAKKLACI
jgi:hypothetical protein